MNLIEFMKQRWDIYGEMTVKVVSFPLPPTPAHGILYMPDCFMTKTFESHFERPDGFKLVHIIPSKFGPALLAYVKLNKLVDFDESTGFLTVLSSTLCASVSYLTIGRRADGVKFADAVSLNRVTFVHRSCHPGSHYAVPFAPYLTTFLQYAQAPVRDKQEGNRVVEIEYATPEFAQTLFPHCEFSTNSAIDSFLGTCVIDPAVSFFKVSSGLGVWGKQYLRQMRHNLVKETRDEHAVA